MCKYDNICVHSNNICDGVVQCIHGADDERMCDVITCPRYCMCSENLVSCMLATGAFHMVDMPRNTRVIILTRILITIRANMFASIDSLLTLNMSKSFFQNVNLFHLIFIELDELRMLDLSHTNVRYLPNLVFKPLISLKTVILAACEISQLYSSIFPNALNLQTLNMRMLSIRTIHTSAFCQLFHLTNLDLSNNLLTEINDGIFNCLRRLNVLNVSHNRMIRTYNTINPHIFSIKVVYVDIKSQCCYIAMYNECFSRIISHKDEKSTCHSILLDSTSLRYTYLSIGMGIIIVNLSSILCSRLLNKRKKNRVVCNNLALSDSLIGLYFLSVSTFDVYYGNQYIQLNDPHLEKSACRFLGILPALSAVMSNTIYVIGALQKLLATKYYFVNKKINIESVYYQQIPLIMLWIIWFSVVILYVSLSTPDSLLCFVPYFSKTPVYLAIMTVFLFVIYGGIAIISSCGIYLVIVRHVITTIQIRHDPSQKRAVVISVVKRTISTLLSHLLSLLCFSVVIVAALLTENNYTYANQLLLCCSLAFSAIINSLTDTIWLLKSR